jgi:hypothetical protein
MRIRTRIFAAAVAATGIVGGAAGVASATAPTAGYRPPVVSWVAPVVHALSNHTAVVHAKYQCSGGNAGTHLFIGVKQGAQINATDHTSSQYADTFYSTNYNADGPGLSLNCDGRSHNVKYVVAPDPFWAKAGATLVPLKAGKAFVQFCVFDSTNKGEDDPNGFAFNYSMKKVVRN